MKISCKKFKTHLQFYMKISCKKIKTQLQFYTKMSIKNFLHFLLPLRKVDRGDGLALYFDLKKKKPFSKEIPFNLRLEIHFRKKFL